MKRILAVALIATCCTVSIASIALEVPRSGQQDNRVRFVNYEPYNVTKVVGSLRSSVQVEFAPDEEIAHVALGNTVAWEVAPAGNILFLKPRESHPATNLQVVTTRRDGSKRSYQFELRSRDGNVENGSDTYFLVKFRYPADDAERRRLEADAKRAQANAAFTDTVLDVHQQYGPRNWKYTAQGSAAIEPVSVYDDGKTTAFTFEENAEIPAIYIENTDGSESLVPKDVRGNLVVTHAIGRKFILRRGADVLCVFNQAYDGKGINPQTGTSSPSVERTVKTQESRNAE
jgi:type IV secretion system protein VirB9